MERDRTLAVAAAGTTLVLVTYTAPIGTLTAIAADLRAGLSAQAWVLSSMSLGLAAGLLAAGAVADDYGRRRMFLIGAVVLALGVVIGALATDPTVFVLGRIVQGLGGAAVTACSLGLIAHAFPPGPPRAHAAGVWGASVGAGIAGGPLLAAALDWRAAYWLIAALTLLLAIAGRALLTESRSETPRPVDVPGVLLLGGGLAALLAGLVEGRSGWAHPSTVLLLVAAAVLVVAFTVVEHRGRSPMLDLGLFGRPDFVGATVGALATGLGVIALMSFLPTLLQRGLAHDPMTAALLLLAWSGMSVLSALVARRIQGIVPASAEMAIGLLGVAAGQAALIGLGTGSSLARLLPGLLVAGVASGVLNAALGRQAVASVPPERAAMGSGANNTARYVGAAVGVTVVAVIISHSGADPAGLLSGWNTAALVTCAFSVAGALTVLLSRERQRPQALRSGS